MLNSIFVTLQTSAISLSMWWDSLNSTYRATSCLLLSFFLMWQATKAAEHDRRFFLTGMIALALLGYGAFTFVQGNGGAQ